MRFIFYSTIHFEDWDWTNSTEGGIGGSETSHVEMAWRLVRRGHEVISYAPVPWKGVKEWRGTRWTHYDNADFSLDGVWIVYRNPDNLEKFKDRKEGKQVWFMSQDEWYPSWTSKNSEVIDKFLALCQVHARMCLSRQPDLNGKMFVTQNGVKVDLIREIEKEGLPKRNPKRLMWASSPDRGLKYLLKSFKKAREFVPDLELHVFYGFNNIDKLIEYNPKYKFFIKLKDEILKLADQPNVFMRGRVSQKELYREWFKTGIWCYQTNFTETSCINSMESQSMGAIPITNPLWALADNIKHGVFIQGDAYGDPLTQARYVGEIVRLASSPKLQDEIREKMMLKSRFLFNWEIAVDQWECWVNKIDPPVYVQWAFQRKHAKGRTLNIGSDGDFAHFHSIGGVNLDVNKNHKVFEWDNKADIIADARNLPENLYNRFDTVVVGDILEHMSEEDGVKVLSNAKKALFNGGHVVITCPNDQRGLMEDIAGAKVVDYAEGVHGYHRPVPKEELIGMIRKAGMEPKLEQFMDYGYFEGNGVVCQ